MAAGETLAALNSEQLWHSPALPVSTMQLLWSLLPLLSSAPSAYQRSGLQITAFPLLVPVRILIPALSLHQTGRVRYH